MGVSRKTVSIGVIAAVVALAFALPAFATVGDSGYISWDSMGGANGTSPHGGFTTTTRKCAVCHAVHNANPFGELLLQSTVAEACEYCHVGGAGGYTQVYGGDMGNYYGTDLDNAHNSWVVGSTNYGVTCSDCHQVHGATQAMTSNPYLTTKILVGGKTYTGTNYDTFAQAPLSTDTSDTALTKWCTACHDSSLGTGNVYYNGPDWAGGTPDTSGMPYTQQAHVMTDDILTYTMPSGETTQVAWVGSGQCSSCHASGYQTSAWPHFTPGVRFLVSGADASESVAATSSANDGVCMRCHRNAGATLGVGVSW